jgi:hypothetical protein
LPTPESAGASPDPGAQTPGASAGAIPVTPRPTPANRAHPESTAEPVPANAGSAAPAPEPSMASPTAEDDPGAELHREPGDTAPDFLLRPPASVTPVADDFFNGLIRRVERDR